MKRFDSLCARCACVLMVVASASSAEASPIPGDDSLDDPLAEAPLEPAESAPALAPEFAPVFAPFREPSQDVPAAAAPPSPDGPSLAKAEPEEERDVSVSGVVVLGLLPYTVAEGALGLGSSLSLDHYSDDAAVGFGPNACYGVSDWLTLGAVVPVQSSKVADERATGLGNVGLSAQFQVFQDAKSGITLGATPGVTLPSPSLAGSETITPDLIASGAVNLGKIAVGLTARGALDVPTTSSADEATPAFDSTLSVIMTDDTFAPFVEGGVSYYDEAVPVGAAGVNWAPGGSSLLTLGVPLAFHETSVDAGLSFSAYFETDLLGGQKTTANAHATRVAAR